MERTQEEAQFVDELLRTPAAVQVYVPRHAPPSSIYHKVVMTLGDAAVQFDTSDTQICIGARSQEQLQLDRSFIRIGNNELAKNWSKFTLYPDPQRKLEKRWLAAFNASKNN